MGSARLRKLDLLAARLQLAYGPQALRRAEPAEGTRPVRRLATSFVELDAALGGGAPQGRMRRRGFRMIALGTDTPNLPTAARGPGRSGGFFI